MDHLDYRITDHDGTVIQKPRRPTGGEIPWYMLEDGKTAAADMVRTGEQFRTKQASRIATYIYCLKLYDNVDAFPGSSGWDLMTVPRFVISSRVTHNIIAECIDTITSKHARSRPRPFFLSSGANWKQRRRVKRLNKFVDGLFVQTDAYQKSIMTFRAAAVFGTGVNKVYLRDGLVQIDAVLPVNLFVDDIEALLSPPRTLYEYREVDRYALEQEFPGFAKEIMAAGPAIHAGNQHNSNQIPIWESWHLPWKKDGKDGRHIIALSGCDKPLVDEKWRRTHFPFAVMQYNAPLFGMWGHGVAYTLLANQIKVNKLLAVQDRQLSLSGRFKWLVPRDAKVPASQFDNATGAVIEYAGPTPPTPIMPPALSPDINQDINDTIRRSLEREGVSQLSVASQKPAGINAAVALRELQDVETERFIVVGRNYERLHMDLAGLGIECVKDAVDRGESYKVKLPHQRYVEEIDFKELDFDEDSYWMQCFSISSLPRDPAGRLQKLTEMVQAGWVSPKRAKQLMDFPDLEASDSLELASQEWIERCLDKMIDDNEYTAPDPYDDFKYGYEAGQAAYELAKLDEVPDERLEHLRIWMEACRTLEEKANAPAGPPAAGPPGLPAGPPGGQPGPVLAKPEAVPVSNILPQQAPAGPPA